MERIREGGPDIVNCVSCLVSRCSLKRRKREGGEKEERRRREGGEKGEKVRTKEQAQFGRMQMMGTGEICSERIRATALESLSSVRFTSRCLGCGRLSSPIQLGSPTVS